MEVVVEPMVERQHALIEQLRARAPRLTSAQTLATDLGVSSRTIERDVARLRAAGLPLRIQTGPGGGYSIDARSLLPPIELTPGEASALVAAIVAVGPFSSATAQTALQKLLNALRAD
ncbi:helix-turn-helix transcriptional regulator [Kibdelosporangium phytohabitans]|uniref:DNA-binding protein n=1 Tax=Kibdelosporangium phytohabitans TaxID=860235 RepID=A0A0N9IBY5_9PSEU|nr:HTH domain-containing protein [Kibdelosporangium phytohabitans]ALG13912.1 DNA-binding protein [Kibdelosporangium phytohabitans]MBE1467151.1 putative DNA-binding transcriptional regulator YafY [Kibdelosporangium phytohabitans]